MLLKIENSVIALILFGLLVQVSTARKTEILDKDGDSSSTEPIAQAVCDITRGADKQISQFSTIDRLIQFFRSLSPDHQLETCAQQSLPALEQMQLILNEANEDVCASAKIELIEKFHRNFISKVRKYRKEQKANNLSAPKILKLFYLHYVSAISATCERAASRELESLTFNQVDQKDDAETIFTQLKGAFGTVDSHRGYKGMYLLWNFIDTLPLENDAKLSQFLHQGKTRLVLQMNNIDNFKAIQDGCRNKLKRLYSRYLMSVVRLADLGFYPENQQLAQLLNSNPNYAHLYTFNQMCGTFLRIYAVKNESLNSDQIVILSKDETRALDLEENIDAEIMNSDSKNRVDSVTSVEGDDSQQFIKKVKEDVNSRVSEHSEILKALIRRFKAESSKDSSQFSLSRGSLREDFKSRLQISLQQVNQSDPLRPIEGDDDDVTREKRGVFKFVKKALKSILLCFVAVGYFITWLVLFILKIIVLVPVLYTLAFFCILLDKDCSRVGNPLLKALKWELLPIRKEQDKTSEG